MSRGETKICATCGRVITWRKKWARDWEHIRYCSKRCRRHRPDDVDAAIERALLEALDAAPAGAALELEVIMEEAFDVRAGALRERGRQAARRLVAAGRAVIVQRGRVVEPSTARGAFQISARSAS